jgi:hypothetical protein
LDCLKLQHTGRDVFRLGFALFLKPTKLFPHCFQLLKAQFNFLSELACTSLVPLSFLLLLQPLGAVLPFMLCSSLRVNRTLSGLVQVPALAPKTATSTLVKNANFLRVNRILPGIMHIPALFPKTAMSTLVKNANFLDCITSIPVMCKATILSHAAFLDPEPAFH